MQTTLDLLPRYSLPLVAIMLIAVVAAFLVVRLATGPAVSLAKRSGLLATRMTLIVLLLALLANPVRVAENPGTIEPADVFFLLDASESMALDDAGTTRWDQAVDMIGRASAEAAGSTKSNVSLFRFGRRLAAIADPQALGLSPFSVAGSQEPDRAPAADDLPADAAYAEADATVPDEPDTQMLVALRQITSRFGRRPPAGVVVFSDGRARDGDTAEQVAGHFASLGVPIHVVPLGNAAKGGDVSIVSLIAPATVRKHSQVNVHAFVRSYGYSGARAEVELLAVDPGAGRESTPKKFDSAPLTLEDGFQSVNLSFQSNETTRTLRARVQPRPDEIATENNQFDTDVRVDRTKIRVLYVEGSPMRYTAVQRAGRLVARGPHSDLQEALEADPDVECTVLSISGSRLSAVSGQVNSFPRTPAELSAYDAILLSSVPSSAFTEEQLVWIDHWIGKRGAGLCMVGGPYSFESGGWNESPLEAILPVEMQKGASWDSARAVAVHPDLTEPLHPIFRLLEDRAQNRELLQSFPPFRGVHAGLAARPNLATVLAAGITGELDRSSGDSGGLFRRLLTGGAARTGAEGAGRAVPAITTGRYGRGRTLAVAMPITGPPADAFRAWGVRGNEYYARFWRNAIYWLTENSFVGRRRLAASADKRFYQPGETITLSAIAYDEAANTTTDYRLVAMIEPQTLDIDSDYALVRWPSGVPRESGEEGPLVMWGEEFEIPVRQAEDGQSIYALDLALADAQAMGHSTGGMRLELTAYEDYTQVDSTSLPLQVLYDPFEQQNPFPNHDLLKTLAAKSGGAVITTPARLAGVLQNAPVTKGPPEIHKTPVWTSWWLLIGLMGVLTLEWCWRRHVGLA